MKRNNEHALIRKIQPNLKMIKKYHHSTFVQHKKNHINLFALYNMKKSIRENKKKLREKKIKLKIS